ncbi:helix-turn-helix domain-containing protein [Microbacterium sp. NPDC089188]|uniref:helix-turn-helix transcriptional regulator n=1 Tax=Microbacterium sp. NPDC089188 TaxID=3154971 RepID=UPI0034409E91
MSPKTLGDLLEVSSRTLERWRAEKVGPAYFSLPGSSLIRYSRADVVAWLTAARVEVTP